MSVEYTGRDLSGQPVYRLSAEELDQYGEILKCETCQVERRR